MLVTLIVKSYVLFTCCRFIVIVLLLLLFWVVVVCLVFCWVFFGFFCFVVVVLFLFFCPVVVYLFVSDCCIWFSGYLIVFLFEWGVLCF